MKNPVLPRTALDNLREMCYKGTIGINAFA